MTKRFKLGYVCGDFGLIDNDEWIDLHSMSENSEKNVQICINKMNELADENEQLKSSDTITDLETKIMKLKQENEELKKQLESEHIMLDNAILLERTRMGQNALKQYKEAIQ